MPQDRGLGQQCLCGTLHIRFCELKNCNPCATLLDVVGGSLMMRIVVAIGLVLMSFGAAHGWPEGHQEAGAKRHPGILANLGGEIENIALTDYVRRVGQKIIARTPYAQEHWQITVVDSPIVNAFATQGGYVYITRGLLALANSEAELAAVLAHEMAHITQNHVAKREKRGNKAGLGVLVGAVLGGLADGKDGVKKGIQVGSKLASGYVAQFSQGQEFDADQVGQRFMIAAGYDPMAQADFLASMAAKRDLEAEIAGRAYNPNQVDFFATHPATGDRVRKARDFAQSIEMRALLKTGEAEYMRAIDGMIYGDSPAQGFVRGRQFIHPDIRFRFEVPPDFVITNSAKAVRSRGPNGATFTLASGGKATGAMRRFIAQEWVPAIAKQVKVSGKLQNYEEYRANGLRAATGYLPVTRKNGRWAMQLTVVEYNGRFYRLTGFARADQRRVLSGLADAARSFAPMSERDARRQRPYTIRTHEVRRGDTVAGLARQMPNMERREARFVLMNALPSSRVLERGDLVKLVQ
jgi:predicted Zn-dependent protease